MGDSVCARIIRALPAIDGVCNVVGNQLIMRFATSFCGILPLTFAVFCGFYQGEQGGCLVVCLGATLGDLGDGSLGARRMVAYDWRGG